MNPKFKEAIDAANAKKARILELRARRGDPTAKAELEILNRKKKEQSHG